MSTVCLTNKLSLIGKAVRHVNRLKCDKKFLRIISCSPCILCEKIQYCNFSDYKKDDSSKKDKLSSPNSSDTPTSSSASNITKLSEKKSSESSEETKDEKTNFAQESVIKVVHRSKERKKLDLTQATTERNFVTPVRAMNDYLLKPSDLQDLRKFIRRSPFDDTPPITVYLRRDVEARALQVWGSFEVLEKERKKRKQIEADARESILNVKRILKDYRRLNDPVAIERDISLRESGHVVWTAVVINSMNFLLKSMAWFHTGSHSLFAEAIHSLADTINQLILYFGIRKSIQRPNAEHPYGYHSAQYIASLISGVGIFCVGSGLSFYHGMQGILHPESFQSFYWAYVILAGSLISEGGTLTVALKGLYKGAKRAGTTMKEYILRSQDPSINVVLLEDTAAVLGVGIAATMMGLTAYTGNPLYDAAGSLLVSGLLASVASFIIYTNSGALVGRSIPVYKLDDINKLMENDVMIRAIHDVKATDLGNGMVRYKAEVDIDGRQLTRHYLDAIDLEVVLQEMKELKTIDEVETFFLKHGENIVDLLGAEIDRVEKELKKKHPQLRHVDLEVL